MPVVASLIFFLILPTVMFVIGGSGISVDDSGAQEASGSTLGLLFGAIALYAIGVFRLLKLLFHMVTGTKPKGSPKKEPPRFNPETDDKSEYYKRYYSDRRHWLNSRLKSKPTEKEKKDITNELAELNNIFSEEMETKQRGGSPKLTAEQRRREQEEREDRLYGPIYEEIVCKLCEEKGSVRRKRVRTKEMTKEYGVIGAKGSIKDIKGNEYTCGNCGGDWFEQTV